MRVSIGYALLLSLMGAALPWVLRSTFFQIFRIEEFPMSGFEFNDLHYLIQPEPDPQLFEVTVINTERFDGPLFRAALASALDSIQSLQPTGIGVDFLFAALPDSAPIEKIEGTKLLQQAIQRSEITVLAFEARKGALPTLSAQRVGAVDFSDKGRYPIRDFQTHWEVGGVQLDAFALALARLHRPDQDFDSILPAHFPLRFRPLSHIQTLVVPQGDDTIPLVRTPGIPVIDGLEFIKNPRFYSPWIQDRVVLLGHCAQSPYTIEDKFIVPSDSILSPRFPSVPGVLIHAMALHNVLNYPEEGWHYVPEALKHFLLFIFLVGLIYFILYTSAGKAMNFMVLGLLSIPLLYCNQLLMRMGWYWPMSATALSFIFVEEVLEVLEPLSEKLKRFAMKLRSARNRVFLLCVSVGFFCVAQKQGNAQSVEVVMLNGQCSFKGKQHAPGGTGTFVLPPGTSMQCNGTARGMVALVPEGRSVAWAQTGAVSNADLVGKLSASSKSFTQSFFEVLFAEDLNKAAQISNSGAVTRGQGATLMPPTEAVVWGDSVWVGLEASERMGPRVDLDIVQVESGESLRLSDVEGGVWRHIQPGQTYAYQVHSFGLSQGSGVFRSATAEERQACAAIEQKLRDACSDCSPEFTNQIVTAWKTQVSFSQEPE